MRGWVRRALLWPSDVMLVGAAWMVCCVLLWWGLWSYDRWLDRQPYVVHQFSLDDGTACVELKRRQSVAVDCNWKETP